MEVPLPRLGHGKDTDVSERDVDRAVGSGRYPGVRARTRSANGRKMSVDPGDDTPHDEVFPDACPLALRPPPLRAARQPAGRHHGDEWTGRAVANERVGDVGESQADDERRGRAPEAVQEVKD